MIFCFENVSKGFTRGGVHIEAIRDLSLQINSGEFVGILGRSRSGKTTALRLAAGLIAPDSGVVTYEGRSLSQMSRSELEAYRRRVARCVFGLSTLNPGLKVIENVYLPALLDGVSHSTAEHAARQQLTAVEAGHCAEALPEEISSGERQRVAIAQALITKPRLLLADEPASHLDPIEQDSLLALMQSLASEDKMAVLIADTEATALMRTKPTFYLRDGELIGEGSKQYLGEVVSFKDAGEKRRPGLA